MGWCTAGSSGEACRPTECGELSGNYSDQKEQANCLLLSVLADERAILLTRHFLYPPILEFRDEILPRSPVGRRMVEYFDRFYPEAVSIARNDPDLVTGIVESMTYVNSFLRALLGEVVMPGRFGPTPSSYRAERLRPESVESVVELIHRFRESASEEFAVALDDFERELGRFVGLSPGDALIALRSVPTG